MRGGKRERRNTDVHGVSTVVLASHFNAFAAVLGQSFSFWIHVLAPLPPEINKQINFILTCLALNDIPRNATLT